MTSFGSHIKIDRYHRSHIRICGPGSLVSNLQGDLNVNESADLTWEGEDTVDSYNVYKKCGEDITSVGSTTNTNYHVANVSMGCCYFVVPVINGHELSASNAVCFGYQWYSFSFSMEARDRLLIASSTFNIVHTNPDAKVYIDNFSFYAIDRFGTMASGPTTMFFEISTNMGREYYKSHTPRNTCEETDGHLEGEGGGLVFDFAGDYQSVSFELGKHTPTVSQGCGWSGTQYECTVQGRIYGIAKQYNEYPSWVNYTSDIPQDF